jgi:hypothetical protein
VAALVLACGVLTSTASAAPPPHLFWANFDGNTLGQANLDGTAANPTFITGGSEPAGVAVGDGHIYWANYGKNTIGEANLDGTGVNQNFITGTSGSYGLVMDGQHLYWSNYDNGTIGEANLDGTDVNESLITGADGPLGMAIDRNHIYWVNDNDTSIGEANLDGSDVNESLVTGISEPEEMAVDAHHLYWTEFFQNRIGRANLDGTGVDESFITGLNGAEGVVVDTQHIYWTNYVGHSIGEANVDGSDVNQNLIGSLDGPVGLNLYEPLSFTGATSATFATGRPGTASIATTGYPYGSLTESGALPGGVSFVDNGNGTATLSGTPAAGSGGTYTLTLSADNALTNATEQFVLTVQAPPTVSIASPANGATYSLGQVVNAAYTCEDGAGGPGISSCSGTVPVAAVIATSTPGPQSFTVTARSSDGQTTTRTVNYTVAPTSNLFHVSRIRTFANGNVAFTVRVPGGGRIDALITAWKNNLVATASLLQPARGRFVYARASRHPTAAVTLRITVHPSKGKARGLVHHHRYRVVLRLWVSYSPTGGSRRDLGFYGLKLPKSHKP